MDEAAPAKPHTAPAQRRGLRARVTSAILEAAASALARNGDVSMAEVADAAGVARATLYRYFPNRDALVDAVAETALADAAGRLDSARIAEIPIGDGVARAVRALVEIGDPFIVAGRERLRTDADAFDRSVATPIAAMFERGSTAGAIRGDVPPRWLAEVLIGLVVAGLGARPVLARDDLVAAISSVFLDGTRTLRVSLP
jgi:AcrR family transcriptional regulator